MTIADKINEIAKKEGIAPITGSIVDVLNNYVVGKGGKATGGSIKDALAEYEKIVTAPSDPDDGEPEPEPEPSPSPDPSEPTEPE